MTWLRILIPIRSVTAVLTVGVVRDGPDLRGEDWTWFLAAGVLLPAFLLALAGGCVAFGVACIREGVRHARGPVEFAVLRRRPMFEDPHMGYLSAVGTFVLAAVFLIVVVVLVGICPPHVQNGHISVMSLWLVTALGVGAFTLLVLLGWEHRRMWVGRGLLLVAVVAVAVSLWQAGSWWRCWEATRYEWYQSRAFAAGWKTHEQKAARRYWAERMIAHRPDDWRGYAERAGTYDLGSDGEAAVTDIESALRLGCNNPSTRAVFGENFSNLGRFVEAAREYDAASTGYATDRKDNWERDADRCSVDAVSARLDAGDLNAVSEWAIARRRGAPNDIDAVYMLATVHIPCGESAVALSVLGSVSGGNYSFDSLPIRAWVMATSPDPAVRDVPAARRLIADSLQRVDDERAELERNPPRFFRKFREDTLIQRVLDTQPILAACDAADGEFERARRGMSEWKEKVKWDHMAHHNGFWARRYARLDECLRDGKPYFDEPVK